MYSDLPNIRCLAQFYIWLYKFDYLKRKPSHFLIKFYLQKCSATKIIYNYISMDVWFCECILECIIGYGTNFINSYKRIYI